mmetsp:Transcript_103792/g.289065  ORF Transcript_103792/g.289065 Transcript_103792/m.289065 type:complete len:225 (+) Transcript_103792:664-1338(+)
MRSSQTRAVACNSNSSPSQFARVSRKRATSAESWKRGNLAAMSLSDLPPKNSSVTWNTSCGRRTDVLSVCAYQSARSEACEASSNSTAQSHTGAGVCFSVFLDLPSLSLSRSSAACVACNASSKRSCVNRSSMQKRPRRPSASISDNNCNTDWVGGSVMSAPKQALNVLSSSCCIGSTPPAAMRRIDWSFGSEPISVRWPSPRARMRVRQSSICLSKRPGASSG